MFEFHFLPLFFVSLFSNVENVIRNNLNLIFALNEKLFVFSSRTERRVVELVLKSTID